MSDHSADTASALAPGRYCLATCYCGECPHYVPIQRPAARVTPAKAPTTSTTWNEREESTWIDGL